ncbi:MAG: tetratricopeptide repeat protein, partial [Vicinamibacterales bacterium]
GRLAAHFGLGRVALGRRDYARAVEHFEAALAAAPAALSVHAPLASAYRGLGDTGQAERHARLAGDADLSPADPLMDEVRTALTSVVSYEVLGTRALNRGDWGAALDAFRKGLALDPAHAAVKQKLGTALYLSGDRTAARHTFEELTRESPGFARGHFSLGMLLLDDGDAAGAERHLVHATERDASYVEAFVSLAEIRRRAGRLREAVTAYDRALALDPRQQEAALGRALTLIRLGRHQEAVDRLRQARQLHPTAPWLTLALARLLAASPDATVRRGEEAMALMETLPADDRRLDFGETMAMAYAEVGRADEAVAWQRESVARAERAGRGSQMAPMQARLRLYESGRPSRSPWSAEELQ